MPPKKHLPVVGNVVSVDLDVGFSLTNCVSLDWNRVKWYICSIQLQYL